MSTNISQLPTKKRAEFLRLFLRLFQSITHITLLSFALASPFRSLLLHSTAQLYYSSLRLCFSFSTKVWLVYAVAPLNKTYLCYAFVSPISSLRHCSPATRRSATLGRSFASLHLFCYSSHSKAYPVYSMPLPCKTIPRNAFAIPISSLRCLCSHAHQFPLMCVLANF